MTSSSQSFELTVTSREEWKAGGDTFLLSDIKRSMAALRKRREQSSGIHSERLLHLHTNGKALFSIFSRNNWHVGILLRKPTASSSKVRQPLELQL